MVHQFIGFFTVNTIFAICSKFMPVISNFNWGKYKSDIWYFYTPVPLSQWYIIYLVAGIAIPILIAYILKQIKKLFENFIRKYKEDKGIKYEK